MTRHGGPENEAIAVPNEFLRVLVGSTAHGTGEDGQEDRDEMGICIPPANYVIGLDNFEQYLYRTQPEGVRSGPGDLDLTIYSLRKWARLACEGNPSVLIPLFVPDELVIKNTPTGWHLRQMAPAIISKRAGKHFLGYMRAQRERLLGTRGGKHTNRPELIERYGYDTKFAMHMIRLGMQGAELLETGRFSVPMPEQQRRFLKYLRSGGYSKHAALVVAEEWEERLKELLETTSLPDEPNHDAVNEFLVETHEHWWSSCH